MHDKLTAVQEVNRFCDVPHRAQDIEMLMANQFRKTRSVGQLFQHHQAGGCIEQAIVDAGDVRVPQLPDLSDLGLEFGSAAFLTAYSTSQKHVSNGACLNKPSVRPKLLHRRVLVCFGVEFHNYMQPRKLLAIVQRLRRIVDNRLATESIS